MALGRILLFSTSQIDKGLRCELISEINMFKFSFEYSGHMATTVQALNIPGEFMGTSGLVLVRVRLLVHVAHLRLQSTMTF